jgi:hypothetical protein
MMELNSSNIGKYIRNHLEFTVTNWLIDVYLPKECDVTDDKELNDLAADYYVGVKSEVKRILAKQLNDCNQTLKDLKVRWEEYTTSRLKATVSLFVKGALQNFNYAEVLESYSESSHIYESIAFCLELQDHIISLEEYLKNIEKRLNKKTDDKNREREISSLIKDLTERIEQEEKVKKELYTNYLNTEYLLQSGYASASEYSSREDEDRIDHIITIPKRLVAGIMERCFIERSDKKYPGPSYYNANLVDLRVASSELSDILSKLVADFVKSDWAYSGFIQSPSANELESIVKVVTLLNKIERLKAIEGTARSESQDEGYTRLAWFGPPQLLADIFTYLFEECVTDKNVRVIKSNKSTMQTIIQDNFCNEEGKSIIFNNDMPQWTDTKPIHTSIKPVQWMWQDNSLAAVFYDLYNKHKIGTRHLLERDTDAIASFINRNFLTKKGKAIKAASIKRVLEATEDERKLPLPGKGDNSKRINLDRFFNQAS